MHIAHVPGDGDKTMGNATGWVALGVGGGWRGLARSGPRATFQQNNRKRFYLKHAIYVFYNARTIIIIILPFRYYIIK